MKVREARRPPGARRLTERDKRILAFISRWQPVTTPAIRARFGVSIDVARRRLRALRDMALLGVFAPVSTFPSSYAVTKKGAEVARAFYPGAKAGLRTKCPSPHHERAGLVFAHFAHALELHGALQRSETERETRRRIGAAPGAKIPDAAFRLRNSQGVVIEVDLGTERPSWVAENKGLAYSEHARSRTPVLGCRRWKVLFVTPDARRRDALLRAFYSDEHIEEGLLYVKEMEAFTEDPIAGWWTARTLSNTQAACVREHLLLRPKARSR